MLGKRDIKSAVNIADLCIILDDREEQLIRGDRRYDPTLMARAVMGAKEKIVASGVDPSLVNESMMKSRYGITSAEGLADLVVKFIKQDLMQIKNIKMERENSYTIKNAPTLEILYGILRGRGGLGGMSANDIVNRIQHYVNVVEDGSRRGSTVNRGLLSGLPDQEGLIDTVLRLLQEEFPG